MTREDAGRPWQFSLKTLLLMPLVLWLLLLACFPKLVTGDFCNIRIEKFSVQKDGQVELTHSTRTPSGTHDKYEYSPGSGDSSGYGTGFPALPRCGSSTICFPLNPDRTPMTAKEIRDRLLVEQGKTYRVTADKPLYFYDFKNKDGTRYYGCAKVKEGNRLGW
jgi:hypothetical protein